MQIFVKQPGSDPIQIDAQPTDTIASIKEQLHLPKAAMWLGRKFLKNGATLEECGVQGGATINAIQSNTVPDSFSGRGQYQAAMRLKSDKIKASAAHPQLHQQTQSVVMAECAQVNETVKEVGDKVDGVMGLLRGEDAPRVQGQCDKTRLKELRLRKRHIDNEISDLRESETKRLAKEQAVIAIVNRMT